MILLTFSLWYLNWLYNTTLRTEKDIGSENPETTTVSGFFRAIFQGGIQKISFPKNDLWGGLELNSTDIKGRFYDQFRKVCPFFVFINVKCLCLEE